MVTVRLADFEACAGYSRDVDQTLCNRSSAAFRTALDNTVNLFIELGTHGYRGHKLTLRGGGVFQRLGGCGRQ
jgi:hypothetical protein